MSEQPPDPKRRRGAGIGVFFAVGLIVSLLLLLPLATAGSDCTQDDLRFKCSLTGHLLLPALPWIALAAGLVLAALGWWLRRRLTAAPVTGLAAAIGVYVIAAAIALGYGAQARIPPDPKLVAAEYAQLAARPDLGQMTTHYQQVLADVERQLDTVSPGASFSAVDNAGGGACAGPFAAVGVQNTDSDDARTNDLSTDTPTHFDNAAWSRALAAVGTAARADGFTSGPHDVDDNIADYTDNYGATLEFNAQYGDGDNSDDANTLIDLTTGCHLTAAAKQRGHP